MLRKKHLLSLLAVSCLFVVFAGCRDKSETNEEPEGATKAANVEPASSTETPAEGLQRISPDPFDIKPSALPSDAELNALGAIREENREFLRFMPDNASSFATVCPARTIQTSFLRDYNDVSEIIVARLFSGFVQYFPASQQIPFSNIKRMSMSLKPIKQRPTLNPMGEYVQSVPDQIATCVCTLELNEPMDDLLLLSIFNRSGTVPVESLKPTSVNGMKAYDLRFPTEEMPVMERLLFVNDRTVVFASGSVSEVTAVFDNEPGQGAIASRILRTDMQNCDLIALYSTEGVTFGFLDMIGPYMAGKQALALFQNQELNILQLQERGTDFARSMKSIAIRINLQAAEAANILQADLDLLSANDAGTLQKNMQTPITELINATSFDLEKNKQMEVPPEHAQAFAEGVKTVTFMISALESLNVTAAGSKVQLSLKKMPGFDQAFQEILTPVFVQSRKVKQTQLDIDAMRNLSRAVDLYLESNMGRFPNYAVMDANGTPLLSWRVAILPYLGEQELYNQFHMNEPWNSEHNRTLIEKMPKWFADPSGQAAAGKSVFRMVGGEGSFLSKHPNGFAISDMTFPQGTLLMIAVSSENAVEWTQPEFVTFDPATFESQVRDIFAAMFCSRETEIFTTRPVLASGEIQHWVAGTISPETAAQIEAQQRYQQYLRMQQMQQQQGEQGMLAPPMQGQPMPNMPQ